MGRYSGLATALSVVADNLRQEKEIKQKQNILGFQGLSQGTIAPVEGNSFNVPGIGNVKQTSGEWKPGTQEEAVNYEQAKYGLKFDSPTAQADRERKNLLDSTKIREEFINRPEVKEYTTINTQVKSMDSLLNKAKTGNVQNKVALDQALITMYNKLTDPNSVVRESEYARTPENLPLANRFNGALQKLSKGGAGLTDKDRESLVWGAKVIANERGNTYNQTLQEYKDLSGSYGIEEKLITRGVNPHTEYSLGKQDNQDIRSQYNTLRSRGISAAEAKRRLGL